jgi:hypothetical protein
MWHFGKFGFTSAVAYDPAKDRNKSSKFPDIAKKAGTHILVRARVKEDLEDIKRVLPSLYIEEDLSADYQYRAVIPRKVMKAYLALTVDDIDYDSHFKEATGAAAKGAKNRHSAMMKVWDAMADLQPNPPYGTSFSWTDYNSTSAKDKPLGGSDWWDDETWVGGGYKSSGTKPTILTKAAEHPDEVTDPEAYKRGRGPKHGFKVGDKVVGYNGEGEVTRVEERSSADLVTVKFSGGRSGQFASNFLCPAEVTGHDTITNIEEAWEYFMEHRDMSAEDFPAALLPQDDDAFEFITRVEEAYGSEIPTKDQLDEIYDQITWEGMDDEERVRWVLEGTVPTMYETEAQRLLEEYENSVAQNA